MKKILVIDDLQGNIIAINEMLGKEFNIIDTSDVNNIVEILDKEKPDLILLDVLMPLKDGFEICKEIKSYFRFKDLPIIFITAKDKTEDIVKGFSYGGQDYVTRPFYVQELLERIRTHIDLKESKEKLKLYIKKLEENNKKLSEISKLDYLTELANRRYMTDRLKEEIHRYEFTNRKFSLILGDLDDFKKINDTFGHESGDKVIQELAKLLKNQLKPSDLASRWGGEEFLVLLPDTEKNEAIEIAEKIRSIVEKNIFNVKGGEQKLTITIGVTEFNSLISLEENISNADKAMYLGKIDGKNTVSCI